MLFKLLALVYSVSCKDNTFDRSHHLTPRNDPAGRGKGTGGAPPPVTV